MIKISVNVYDNVGAQWSKLALKAITLLATVEWHNKNKYKNFVKLSKFDAQVKVTLKSARMLY